MSPFVVLGIDPGLASTGYAVAEVDLQDSSISRVHTLGVSRTAPLNERTVRKTSDHLTRAKAHAKLLRSLIDRYRVTAVAFEITTLTPHLLPTLSFGIMTGIIATLGRPIIDVLPKEVKRVAGDTKRDVIGWALAKTGGQSGLPWPTSSRPNAWNLRYEGKNVTRAAEHPADALAAIEAALGTPQFELAVTMTDALHEAAYVHVEDGAKA